MASVFTRSVCRNSSIRNIVTKLTAETKFRRTPLRFPKTKPPSVAFFRSPVELSFGVESLLPFHSATASAVLTSMLSVNRLGNSWLSEAICGYYQTVIPAAWKVRALHANEKYYNPRAMWIELVFTYLGMMTYDIYGWIGRIPGALNNYIWMSTVIGTS